MRIDAHQHFWHYDAQEYAWINESMAALKRDFLPPDLRPLLSRWGFQGCVAVQARQSLAETRWLLSLTDEYQYVRGVVGWVDLCSAELPAQLEELAKHPKLVGVRHVVQDEPDDDFVLRADFQRGIARLAEFELTYDVLIYPRQLRAATKLVAAFPDQPFVLDHIGKPDIAHGSMKPWEAGIRELGRLPNVCCKLSGMVTETHWKRWRPEDFMPYLEVVFEAFGADRLMIGSDWPVCTLSGEYGPVMDIVMRAIEYFPGEARDKILGRNCSRFYGLG